MSAPGARGGKGRRRASRPGSLEVRRIEPDPFRGPTWSDRWVLPFLREPTLWPVLAVLVAHGAAFLAPLLLLGLRDHRAGALAALTAAVLASAGAGAREWARRGRPGGVGLLLAATWSLGGAGAIAADRYGLF